jgi:phosphatidylinositol alpha 1,6-mannosyltransferase
VRRVRNGADRTLAPSSASAAALHQRGIERVRLWRRGVDAGRFNPDQRSAALRRALSGAMFLGERRGAQLGRLYASFNVFAHTGPYETFGQTVQEALASAVPVVAPATGGPLYLVDHGHTGLLVPPCDGRALAAAVGELVADPAKRAAFGANARSPVAGRSWSAVCDELIGHYVSVHSGELGTPVRVAA